MQFAGKDFLASLLRPDDAPSGHETGVAEPESAPETYHEKSL